jgi:peptidyl-prolyl cis-trans isomerase-like 4
VLLLHALVDPRLDLTVRRVQDPPGLRVPDASPARDRPVEETVPERLKDTDVVNPADQRTEAEIDESLKAEEAKSRAVVLEIIGDIPDADVKPPEHVLFVCKLNPVTRDSDLELIFSRFGEIKRCGGRCGPV